MSWKREKGRRVALAAWSSKNGSHFVWWQPSLAQQRLLPLTMHCCIHWAAKWLFQAGTQSPLLGTLVPHRRHFSALRLLFPRTPFNHSFIHSLTFSIFLYSSAGLQAVVPLTVRWQSILAEFDVRDLLQSIQTELPDGGRDSARVHQSFTSDSAVHQQ
mgnify:CR=1 FL=1